MAKHYRNTPMTSSLLAGPARWLMGLIGWKVEGSAPDLPKWVMIAAPHTHNLDGLLMVLTALTLRVRLNWLVKDSLPWIVNQIAQAFGGVPINRSGGLNLVEQVVERFNKADQMVLGVSPEGTRKKVDYWKTGFYYIALKAKVPIGFGYLDYKTKTAGCHPEPFYPTGDIEADFAAFRDFYKEMVGRVPSNFTNAALKPERTTEY